MTLFCLQKVKEVYKVEYISKGNNKFFHNHQAFLYYTSYQFVKNFIFHLLFSVGDFYPVSLPLSLISSIWNV